MIHHFGIKKTRIYTLKIYHFLWILSILKSDLHLVTENIPKIKRIPLILQIKFSNLLLQIPHYLEASTDVDHPLLPWGGRGRG